MKIVGFFLYKNYQFNHTFTMKKRENPQEFYKNIGDREIFYKEYEKINDNKE